jgi:hypothetical protein
LDDSFKVKENLRKVERIDKTRAKRRKYQMSMKHKYAAAEALAGSNKINTGERAEDELR